MTMEEILRGMSSLRVCSIQSDTAQKVMQVSLNDQATAIQTQKSSTDLLSTLVEELRTELKAVKDQLAQQTAQVNRAERLSTRSHSNRMHEALRADQKILLLNDVTPLVEDQSQTPLSTLTRSQFRDSLRACLSVVLNHQNVAISLLPPSKLQPLYAPAKLIFRTSHDAQSAKGALIRFLRPHTGITIRSPEPSSGNYRGPKKALSDLCHSIKSIGGLVTAYSISPIVDETNLKLVPSLSFSIQKYPLDHADTLQHPERKNHTVQLRASLSTPIPQSGLFSREFFLKSQGELLSQIIQSQIQQGLNPEPLSHFMTKAAYHNDKYLSIYCKSAGDRLEKMQPVASNDPPAQVTPTGSTSTVGRTPPNPHKPRTLSIASRIAIVVSGSDLHSGKRIREPAGTSPSKPAKKPVPLKPGARKFLFSAPAANAASEGAWEDEENRPESPDGLVDYEMEAANYIEPY